jgi:hypothetical protein
MLDLCYTITPATGTGVSATLDLYYQSSLPGGALCPVLSAYRWDGGGWEALTPDERECGITPYRLTVRGVTDFSPFALGVPSQLHLPLVLREGS